MTATCPECSGPQLLDHPRGLLMFNHDRAACSLGRAEDSTADADLRRAAGWIGPFVRPISDAEKTLLAAVGIAPRDRAVDQRHADVAGDPPAHWTPKESA
jgi:hypothetical protein